jgi:hypothetical protein
VSSLHTAFSTLKQHGKAPDVKKPCRVSLGSADWDSSVYQTAAAAAAATTHWIGVGIGLSVLALHAEVFLQILQGSIMPCSPDLYSSLVLVAPTSPVVLLGSVALPNLLQPCVSSRVRHVAS